MEAKQISLFCLLLAALAGKIETKPSGSLSAVTAGEAQLSSISAASVGQSNVDHFSSNVATGLDGGGIFGSGSVGTRSIGGSILGRESLGSTGSFGTGTGGAGTLQRGYSSFGCADIIGNLDFNVDDNLCTNQCSGLGLGGIGGSQYPISSIAGLDYNRFQNLPCTSLGCLGQQQNLPFTSLGSFGQQQYGSLSNFNPCGTAGSQGGLSCLSLPYTSCSQVGSQDLGCGYPCGCQGSFDDISLNSNYGNYGLRQSLPSYSADFSCLGNTQLQGIPVNGGIGSYQQGITGCTCYSPSLESLYAANYNCLGVTQQEPCTSCSENTCASCADPVIVLPVAECGVEPTCTETC